MSEFYFYNMDYPTGCETCSDRDAEYGNRCMLAFPGFNPNTLEEQFRFCPKKDIFKYAIKIENHGNLIDVDKLIDHL